MVSLWSSVQVWLLFNQVYKIQYMMERTFERTSIGGLRCLRVPGSTLNLRWSHDYVALFQMLNLIPEFVQSHILKSKMWFHISLHFMIILKTQKFRLMQITLKWTDHAICTDKLSQDRVITPNILWQILVMLYDCSLFITPLIFMTHCAL